MRAAILGVFAAALAAQVPLDRNPAPGVAWRVAYFHDEDDSQLVLRDLKIADGVNAIALGTLVQQQQGKRTGVVLATRDGGTTWETQKLSEEPVSAFFLTAKLGWMVTTGHIWSTGDSGRTWRRLARHDGLRRVWFTDENRGFAAGARKQAVETRDGGQHWTKIEGVSEVKAAADRTQFLSIEFSGKVGVIAGVNEPRRPDDRGEPAWLDAEMAAKRRQLPSLSILLQTIDGGQTWKASTNSIMGVLSHYRLAPPSSVLSLVQFQYQFDWPSEVYLLDIEHGRMDRVYREKDRAIQDLTVLDSGAAYLAGIEPPGTLRGVPVPGKVKIARSIDKRNWREMEVDYRAVANRVMLANLPTGPVWAATDTGMILVLTGTAQTK